MKRHVLLAIGALVAVVLAALAMDIIASRFFLMTVGASANYTPGMTFKLLETYGVDPIYRARITKIVVLMLFLASVGVSMLYFLLFRRNSSLHGKARWASRLEIEREGLMGNSGIIFGKLGGRYLLLPGQRHVLAIAPTRTGKTTGIAIPNLLNWSDSAVVLDMKLELFARTSGFRAFHGHEVYVFNPYAEDFRTNRWNPLDGVRRGAGGRLSVFTVRDLMGIATVLYPSKEGDATSQFFASQAQNLFVGIALYVMETGQPFTFPQILAVRATPTETGFSGFLQEVVRTRTELSDTCRQSLTQFLGSSGDTLSSIVATFDAPLQVFRNALVAAATGGSDFKLSDLRRRRMTIYLGIAPRDLEQGSVLMTLFVSQVLDQNLDKVMTVGQPNASDLAPESDPTLKHQLLLLLDEFRVLGKMSVLVDAAGFVAGYGIRLLTILQSSGQLGIYSDKTARAFMTNHGCKVVYAPREEADAKEISEALGTFTEMSDSYSQSTRSGRLSDPGSGLSASTSTSAQRRALMMPQEVKLMSFKEEIAFIEGMPPIRADKVLYFDDPVFRDRLHPPVIIASLDVPDPASPRSNAPVTASVAGTPPASTMTPAVAVASQDESALPSQERINAEALDRELSEIRMESVDPYNPADNEVDEFCGAFMKRLEELGFWS
jgi:type IV secretion system protein VirD4